MNYEKDMELKIFLRSGVKSAVILALWFCGCSDHNTTVRVDLPEYKPTLIIQSAASPLSGGEALIRWSLPLRGQPGEVPPFPDLAVFLLADGARVGQFTAVPDSAGYFIIPPEKLDMRQGVGYSIEVDFDDTDENLFSGMSYLPPEPVMKDVEAKGADRPELFRLSFSTGATDGAIRATSVAITLIDNNGNRLDGQGLLPFLGSDELTYVDEGNIPERDFNGIYRRVYLDQAGDVAYSEYVDVRMAYLSAELAAFYKEVEEINYFGETIFQTVRPIYSNIEGAVGVFGVYNEAGGEIEVTD